MHALHVGWHVLHCLQEGSRAREAGGGRHCCTHAAWLAVLPGNTASAAIECLHALPVQCCMAPQEDANVLRLPALPLPPSVQGQG
jgi:hypothetical protein